MFKKLRNRFLILNMSIISVLMIVAFVFVFVTTYNNENYKNENKLRALPAIKIETLRNPAGDTIKVAGEGDMFFANGQKMQSHMVSADFSLSFSIELDDDSNILNVNSFIDMPDELYEKAAELAMSNKKDNSIINLEGKRWQYKIVSPIYYRMITNGQQFFESKIESNRQIVFLDVTDTYQMLKNLVFTLFLVGIVMLFVIFGVSLYFADKAILPIQEAWEKQKQFVSDASHELKTPLAIINANSDALLANQEEAVKNQEEWLNYIETEKEWLGYIKSEANRMAKLIGNLLYLAKTEDTNANVVYMPFNISNTVNNVILSMEAIIFENDINLSYAIEPDITAKGDLEQIKQVVMILIDNAIKYTNEKGYINITLKKAKRHIIFTIQNSGNGIAKQDLKKLFDRFYRADPSRARESGGYGLGLPIAKAIIERMGGKLYATSVENESVAFSFILWQ